MAFELITGEYLFACEEWTAFYLRLTTTSMPVVSVAQASKLPNGCGALVLEFLHAVLQRDPAHRPHIAPDQVIVQVAEDGSMIYIYAQGTTPTG